MDREVIFSNESVEVVCIRLAKGHRIPPHDHPNVSILMRVEQGAIEVSSFEAVNHTDNDRVSLKPVDSRVLNAGNHLTLSPGVRDYHTLLALEDSVLLDVISPKYDLNQAPSFYRIISEDTEQAVWERSHSSLSLKEPE